VSSEPIVFVGPGSEWFWVMTQFVVVAITLIGIYYQFKLQRAATTFEQLNRLQAEWYGEQQTRAKVQAARAIHGGQLASMGPANVIGNFCQSVATLIRRGHVSSQAVYETMGASLIFWWVLLEDTVKHARVADQDPTLFDSFEWLAHTFEALARKDNIPPETFDRRAVIGALTGGIASLEERIRLYEDSRAVPSPAARRRQK
jgi:hypothetical protein